MKAIAGPAESDGTGSRRGQTSVAGDAASAGFNGNGTGCDELRMLGSVGVVGLHGALRFADAMPGRDDGRTGKPGELPVDLLRLSIEAAHCADTASSHA